MIFNRIMLTLTMLLYALILYAFFYLISSQAKHEKDILKNSQVISCNLIERKYESVSFGYPYNTTFDCGTTGFLVSHDSKIFQYATKETKLRISGNKIIELVK